MLRYACANVKTNDGPLAIPSRRVAGWVNRGGHNRMQIARVKPRVHAHEHLRILVAGDYHHFWHAVLASVQFPLEGATRGLAAIIVQAQILDAERLLRLRVGGTR